MNTYGNHFRSLFAPMIFSVFAMLIFAICACTDKSDKSSGTPEKITFAYSTGVYYILPGVALKKGFFAAEGLEVTLQHHPVGKMALDSLLAGKADFATSADTPFVFAVLGGSNISMLAVIASSGNNIGIVAKKDKGIVSPRDLKGKKIGVMFGTSVEYFADLFLSVRGIGRNDVGFVNLAPEEMMVALTTDRVDAVAIWQPLLMRLLRELGNNGIVFYDKDIYHDSVYLSTSREMANKRPEIPKKVLKALIRAETFAKQHPDEFRKLVSELTKTDEKSLDEMLDIGDFGIGLDQSMIVELEDQTRWAIKSKLTEKTDMPNYYDFIHTNALKSVKPEAVSIMR